MINSRYKPTKIELYGFIGVIKIVFYIILTKIFYPTARLIRRPFDVRGKKYINFGSNITIGKYCRIEAYPYLHKGSIIEFGKNVEINDFVHIAGLVKVKICDNVLIASKVYISDLNHGLFDGSQSDTYPEDISGSRPVYGKEIIIQDNVWICESVSVLPGVTIGRCSVIGANSVVTKDIPPFTIAVGVPAKPIKKFNFDKNKWEPIIKSI